MRSGCSGLVRGSLCGMVVLVVVAGCSGSGAPSGDAADGPSAGSSTSAPTSSGPADAGSAARTATTVPISGGTHVSDGAAEFDLPAGVAFGEAPATVQGDARQRTWRHAPDPSSALCVITLVQQPGYTQPFPETERQLLRARVEQVQGGTVLVDEAGAGPDGTASGWVTQHET